jgi:hypothetical protein
VVISNRKSLILLVLFILISIEVSGLNVQRNTYTGTGQTLTTTLPQSVNASEAFLLFRANTNDPSPDDWQFTCNMTDTDIYFYRYDGDGGADSSTISWQVIEDKNLYVQRGTAELLTGNTTADITINSVDLSKSFIIVYGRCGLEDNNENNGGFFSGNFSNSTSIHLERGNEANCNSTVSWQVIEWDEITVESGTTTFPSSTDTHLVDIGSSVDLSKSVVIHSSASIGTDTGMDTNLIWADFNSDSQIKFMKKPGTAIANADRIVTWYVFTHPMMFRQHDTIYFGADTTIDLVTSIVLNRTFHWSNVWNTGAGQTYTNHLYYLSFFNESRLTVDKETGNQNNNVSWFVMEFNNPFDILLDFPLNDSNFTYSQIDLNFTIIDEDNDIENCTLYTNSSGTWQENSTVFNPLSNTELNFTLNFLDGRYEWNVFCVDLRNYSMWNSSNITFILDTTPPTIYDLQNISISNESALIIGYTNELANGTLQYGTSVDNLNNTLASSDIATYHSVPMADLQPLTQYFYNVTACDVYGNCDTIGPYDFNTTDTADLEAPVIFNVQNISIQDYSTEIIWNTSEISNGSVNYGDSFPLTNFIGESTLFDLFHDFNLTGLTVNTRYYYNVTSCDPSGNCNTSDVYSFLTIDTLPPEITLIEPIDASNHDEEVYINFNYSVNDSQTTVNCSLYGDFNGTWEIYDIVNNPVDNQVYNFNYLLNRSGLFSWNVFCIDNSSYSTWAEPTNRTFSVSFPPPKFRNYSVNNSNPYRSETIQINVTIVDLDLKNYTFGSNLTGTWINYSSGDVSAPQANVSTTLDLSNSISDQACYKWYASDFRFASNESSAICINIRNSLPTHSTPLLESSSLQNTTSENLICYNQSTSDIDSDSVKNIYLWTRNGTSTLIQNLMFENNSPEFIFDYSGLDNFGNGTDLIYLPNGGYDGFGAFEFNGLTSGIDMDYSTTNNGLLHDETFTNTVFLRFYADDVNNRRVLWEEGGNTNGLNIYVENGYLYAGAWDNNAGNWTNLTTTSGEWHSVGFVYDSANFVIILFQDNLTSTATVGFTEVSGHTGGTNLGISDNCRYHDDTTGTGSSFDGIIDDYYVWDEVLTIGQLEELSASNYRQIDYTFTDENNQWQCSITPVDGVDNGIERTSNTITILANIVPQWSNIFYNPLDPSIYNSSENYFFNISWSDIDGVSNVTIEHDFSGSLQNYSMIEYSSNNYNYTYQGILPGNRTFRFLANDTFNEFNQTTSYYYIVVNNTLDSTENITVNEDVEIDWQPVESAESYTVYYTDDLAVPFTELATGITDSNWTDPGADSVTERYYQISATVLGEEINTTKTIGKRDYSSTNNWSLISVPFNLSDPVLKNNTYDGLRIHTEPENCVVSIYRYDTSGSCFSQTDVIGDEWYPAAGCDNFVGNNLEQGRGYWFFFNESCQVSFVGEVPDTTMNIPLVQDYNVVGWFSTQEATLPTGGEPPYYPITTAPVDSVRAIITYDESTLSFYKTDHYSGWGWWPATGSSSFTSLEPMKSYYFIGTGTSTWSYTTR